MSKTVAIVTGKKRGRPAKAAASDTPATTEVATGTGFIAEPPEPATNGKIYAEPVQFCSVIKNHPEPRGREVKNGKPEKWDSKKNRCWGCVMSMRSDHSEDATASKPHKADKAGKEATNGHEEAFTNLVIVLHDAVPEAPTEMIHKIATRLVTGGFTLKS